MMRSCSLRAMHSRLPRSGVVSWDVGGLMCLVCASVLFGGGGGFDFERGRHPAPRKHPPGDGDIYRAVRKIAPIWRFCHGCKGR